MQIASEHQSRHNRHSDSHCQPQLGSQLQLVWTFLGSLAHCVPTRFGPHVAGTLLLQGHAPGLWTRAVQPWRDVGHPERNPRRAKSLLPSVLTIPASILDVSQKVLGGGAPTARSSSLIIFLSCFSSLVHSPFILTPPSQDHLPNKPCKHNPLLQLLLFSGES